MEEQEVDVVRAQALQGGVDVRPALGVGVGLREELGGDEEVRARHRALGHDPADGDLVEVGVGGVDVPVPGVDRLGQVLVDLGRGHLEDAVTQGRDFKAIVHGEELHG